MVDRFIAWILVTIAGCSLYASILCYSKISEYEGQIKMVNKRLDDTMTKWTNLNEEDLVLLRRFDQVNKRFTEVEQRIKVNDIRITEIGAKVVKKK